MSFELAAFLFESHPAAMFPAAPTEIAFPSLTRLTLVDIEDRKVVTQAGQHDKVPRIPFHDMPNLTHVHIPFGHRGFDNSHSMHGATLQSLARHTRVQSFVAPGLIGIISSEDQGAGERVVAEQLTRVQVPNEVAGELARWIILPNSDLST